MERRNLRIGLLLGGGIALFASIPSGHAQNAPYLSAQDAALIGLARAAVTEAVTGQAAPVVPTEMTRLPAQGIFVTIERGGTVIGCRGTLRPRCANLADEVRTSTLR